MILVTCWTLMTFHGHDSELGTRAAHAYSYLYTIEACMGAGQPQPLIQNHGLWNIINVQEEHMPKIFQALSLHYIFWA